jgi:glycosyltransferase involved in cell wall biosynthesis
LGLQARAILPRRDRQLFADIDLVIVPTISYYPIFFLPVPFVITIHDFQERYLPSFFSPLDRLLRNIFQLRLSRHAAHILCESNYVRRDIIKFLAIKSEKISIIPAPPPRSIMESPATPRHCREVKLRYHLPDLYLYYPAQFWHHKNHLRLLEALLLIRQRHPELHLVLSGARHNSYDLVRKKITELELDDVVHIVGYADYADLPAIYQLSQALIMPSLFESISIPIYEAFALGIPVCCSNILALPEQVGTAGLLFDPLNTSDIADTCNSLLEDIPLRERCREQGCKKISSLSHADYSSKLRSCIDSILAL